MRFSMHSAFATLQNPPFSPSIFVSSPSLPNVYSITNFLPKNFAVSQKKTNFASVFSRKYRLDL